MSETKTDYKWAIRTAGLAALAAVLTLLVYLPSVRYGFVSFDDLRYVPDNAAIRRIDLAFIKHIFTTVIASNWHPLTIFSYAADYALWGAAPMWYHLENIIWHAVNTGLVFTLVVRLYALKQAADGRALFAGLTASLLFGLHPIHVESVTWISERKDVLSGFFFILSLLAYLRYAGPENGKRLPYYLVSFFAFALAALAKPMAVTLPAVLLLIDIYPLERLKAGASRIIGEKVPFLAISAATAGMTLWAQGYGGAIKTFGAFPAAKRIFLAVRGPVFYLYKMVWPFDLSPLYLPPVDASLASPGFILCLAAVLAISAACLMPAGRNKICACAWIFFIVTLLPVLGIVQAGDQAAADRYAYLPSLGPFILAGAAAGAAFASRPAWARRAAVICLAAISVFLAARTVSQQAVWKDSITLWTRVIEAQGEVPLAYNSRGDAYLELGEQGKAMADFDRAIELDPAYAFPYNNRGYLYQRMGDFESALEDYNRAIGLDPGIASPYNNRGLLFYERDEFSRAAADFKKAIALDPKLINPYLNLALACAEMGDIEGALDSYGSGLKISPMNPLIFLNRGLLYMRTGQYGKAAPDFETSIKYGSEDAAAWWGAAMAYLRLRENEKADERIRKAAGMGLPEAQEYMRKNGM